MISRKHKKRNTYGIHVRILTKTDAGKKHRKQLQLAH